MIGNKFGRLTVIEECEKRSKNGHKCYKCLCECGNTKIIREDTLKSGASKSCGCSIGVMHGLSKTRLYKILNGVKNRCYNENTDNYGYYGGRGIKVCDEWLNDFMSFYNWAMNNGYKEDLTIDRIDPNGNYEPNNCRWVTMKYQANNKKNNVMLTYDGETKTLSQWANDLNVNYNTIVTRYHRGWDIKDVLFGRCNKKVIPSMHF